MAAAFPTKEWIVSVSCAECLLPMSVGINLNYTPLTGAAILSLVHFNQCSTLKELALSLVCDNITNEEALPLHGLQTSTSLQWIELRTSDLITDIVKDRLRASIRPSLECFVD